MMTEIIYKEESYAIVGACFEVYKELGCGFLEPVYQECLEMELQHRAIPFVSGKGLILNYKGRTLEQKYVPDFVCYEKIIFEIKAVKDLANEHRAQVHNYLKATAHRLALLINFGHYPNVGHERIAQ